MLASKKDAKTSGARQVQLDTKSDPLLDIEQINAINIVFNIHAKKDALELTKLYCGIMCGAENYQDVAIVNAIRAKQRGLNAEEYKTEIKLRSNDMLLTFDKILDDLSR